MEVINKHKQHYEKNKSYYNWYMGKNGPGYKFKMREKECQCGSKVVSAAFSLHCKSIKHKKWLEYQEWFKDNKGLIDAVTIV